MKGTLTHLVGLVRGFPELETQAYLESQLSGVV
jgi:hypothetical protein